MTRAPYASDPAKNRGRLHAEPESRTRTAFQRDRDRIIHSTAFRRLKHKTQVFVYHEGDHFRTRLTHSLEVAQIARSIARTLALDEDLAEALALSHDLGHTCFGHAGEDALAMCMAPYGGFDHNAHALRLVTRLELRYPEWDGLNLTWDTLEGLVKHNGPLVTADTPFESLPEAIREYNVVHDLWLSTYASLEAQVAALSDDIAYNNHDIDDGLRAELFPLDDLLAHVPLVRDVFAAVRRKHPALDQQRLVAEAVRDLIGIMVDDVLAETRRGLEAITPRTVDDVRTAPRAIVAFSPGLLAELSVLRRFLFERMYHHHKVDRVRQKMKRLMVEMFDLFIEQPALMPPEWSRLVTAGPKTAATARVVSDYIAGMTDRFAVQEHRRLFSPDVLA